MITGASAGLGWATAREFGRRGAKIGLLARGIEALEAAKREDFGGTALVLPTDVANSEAIEQAAAVIEEQLGPIDIWVNNAMASVFSPVKEMKPEEFKRVTEVTYLGPSTERLRLCAVCCRAIEGQLCRSARHWRIEVFRCNPHIARPSTPLQDLPTHCVAN